MNQHGPLALLVDDDTRFLEILSVKLASLGFRIEQATSGLEAIEKVRRGTIPDVILLDMKMPGMDGSDTLHALRGEPALKDAKAFFLSGIIAADDRQFKIDEQFARDQGATGCIRKTDNLDTIASEVGKYVSMPVVSSGGVVAAQGGTTPSPAVPKPAAPQTPPAAF